MGVTLFLLEKNLTTFLVIVSVMTLLAVVCSPLPSSHIVFFLNSATTIILGQVSAPGGCHPRRSSRPLVTPLVHLVVLACVLRVTTKNVMNFFEEKSAPAQRISWLYAYASEGPSSAPLPQKNPLMQSRSMGYDNS